MQQVDRTKICWDCEADVNDQATYCPFCGTDLLHKPKDVPSISPPKKDPKFSDQTLEESLASLYKPPYSVRNRQGLGVPDEREESVYREKETLKSLGKTDQSILPTDSQESREKGTVLPLLFLMIGSHLFILGILLFFCSKNEVVTLEWSRPFWFVYLLTGSPLLYFGIQLIKNQKP